MASDGGHTGDFRQIKNKENKVIRGPSLFGPAGKIITIYCSDGHSPNEGVACKHEDEPIHHSHWSCCGAPTLNSPCGAASRPHWGRFQWQDDKGKWNSYHNLVNNLANAAKDKGLSQVEFRSGQHMYVLDLRASIQINVMSRTRRPVRVVGGAPDPALEAAMKAAKEAKEAKEAELAKQREEAKARRAKATAKLTTGRLSIRTVSTSPDWPVQVLSRPPITMVCALP